jgi:hypothetical protein
LAHLGFSTSDSRAPNMLFVYGGINVFIRVHPVSLSKPVRSYLILSYPIPCYRWLAHEIQILTASQGFGFCSLHASALEQTSPQYSCPAATGSLWILWMAMSHGRTEVGTLSTLINTLWYAYHGEDQANFYLVRAWGKRSEVKLLQCPLIHPLRQPNCWKQDPSTCYSPFCSFSPVEVPHLDEAEQTSDCVGTEMLHLPSSNKNLDVVTSTVFKRVWVPTVRNPMNGFEWWNGPCTRSFA